MMSTKKVQNKVGEIIYNNKNIGFSITIPDNWLEIKKSSYQDLGINDNTLFVFSTGKFSSISAVFSGFCKKEIFDRVFNDITFDKKIKVITKGDKRINRIDIKYVVTEFNEETIMNIFCLINEMLINFNTNLNTKKKILDVDKVFDDDNVKKIIKVLDSIEIYEPINPPIYIDQPEEKNDVEKIVSNNDDSKKTIKKINRPKKIGQQKIEMDCKYKHILCPDFYLKYIYKRDNQNITLSVVNDEIYFVGPHDDFRFIKNDKDLSSKIKNIISNNLNEIMVMDTGFNDPKTDSTIAIKSGEDYVFVDVLDKNNDINLLNRVFEDILNNISQYCEIDFKKYNLFPKPEEKKKVEDLIIDKKDEDKKEISDKIKKESNDILEKIKSSKRQKNEMKKKETENPFEKVSDDINDVAEKVVESPKKEFALNNLVEYFHNIDGHASFRFLFPEDSGEMNVRDFNVFDIVDDGNLEYRIFIFKCDTYKKYEEKLNDWMDKNIQSSHTAINNVYERKNDNGLTIKTYVLENGRFYKIVYKYGYLISVSSYYSDDKLFYSDYALDTCQIGEDDRENIESQNRKNRSIEILKKQGIPYIDELPTIPSSYEIAGKSLDDIAKRAIILCICCNYASDLIGNRKKKYIKDSKKFFNKLLNKFNVRDAMTRDEKNLFEKVDKNQAVQISWQFEGYNILLWTLGLIDEIEFPDVLVNADEVTSIVSSCENYKEFIDKCQLRDVNDVLDLADLTYRYDWYCVESKINEEEPVINPDVVMERHRALKWLLSDDDWDKIEINT